MKLLSFLIILSIGLSGISQSTITILPNSSSSIENGNTESQEIALKNTSQQSLEINLFTDGQRTGGFGFGPKGKTSVTLASQSTLEIINPSPETVIVNQSRKKAKRPNIEQKEDTYVNLTFRNKSAKSIPLIIPTVMNPNLSPFSNSGVSLKIGQKVLFKYRGKRHVLIQISKENYQDEVIDVAQVLKERKKQIDAK